MKPLVAAESKARCRIPSLPSAEWFLGILAALLWLGLAFDGARRKSPVVDESLHLAASYAIVGLGDWRFNAEHPPLVKMLTGLAILLPTRAWEYRDISEADEYRKGDEWVWASYFVYQKGEGARDLVRIARVVPILLGLCGGLLVAAWAAQIGGRRAGLFAFLLLLFYPEYLGHSQFVTFDVPTAAGCAAVSLAGWFWWKYPSWEASFVYAFVCATASLIKLPVLVFVALTTATLMLLWAAAWMATKRSVSDSTVPQMPRLRHLVLLLVFLLPMMYGAQWAAAGFHARILDTGSELELMNPYARMQNLPDTYAVRMLRFLDERRLIPQSTTAVLAHAFATRDRTFLLHGEYRKGGHWNYFIVTTGLKTPLVYLAGAMLAAGFFFRRLLHGKLDERVRLLLLVLPVAGLAALTMLSGVNHGHRYVLFLYVPWAILMGAELARWSHESWVHRIGAAAFLLTALCICILWHPHQATYFNMLAGGSPRAAAPIMNDSNIDWGSDLPAASSRARELGFDRVNLLYFGSAQPHCFGFTNYHVVNLYGGTVEDNQPLLVSLQFLDHARRHFPEHVREEPLAVCNSILIFPPLRR